MALHSSRLRRLKARRHRRRSAPETRRTSIHVNPLVLNRTMTSLSRQFSKRHVRRLILRTWAQSSVPKITSPQLRLTINNFHRVLNHAVASRQPLLPSISTPPELTLSRQPVGPALLNLLDNSLSMPGTQTQAGMFMPSMPPELPPIRPMMGAVFNLSPSYETRRTRLLLMLKAAKIDYCRYAITLSAVRRRISSVNDDLRHVEWISARSEQDIRNAESKIVDLRQRYHELMQRVIDRHAPADGDLVEEEDEVPEQYQDPVVADDGDVIIFEAPEPEGLMQRLLIDENNRFGLI